MATVVYTPGDDVSTDAIYPGRFMATVLPSETPQFCFADDKAFNSALQQRSFAPGSVVAAGQNFGCGSSREHAPQGLARWGIKAIVAESFAEIFFANATALGVPCVTVSAADARALTEAVGERPAVEVVVDVAALEVRTGATAVRASMPASAREAFLSGTWDATALLTADYDVVRAAAARLPYIAGF